MATTDIPPAPNNSDKGNGSDQAGDGGNSAADPSLHLSVLPLPDGVVMPDTVVTVTLASDGAQKAITAADDEQLLLVPRVDGAYARVGVVASVEDYDVSSKGAPTVTLRAHRRAVVGRGVIGANGELRVSATPVTEPPSDAETTRLATEYRAAAANLIDQVGGRRMVAMLPPVDQPGPLADSVVYWPDLTLEQRVELLETIEVKARLRLAISWVRDALAEVELRNKIQRDVNEDLEKTQKEAILRRQMTAIQNELGDGPSDDAADYRAQLDELIEGESISQTTAEAIGKEIDRLERSGSESAEAAWLRTWLETVLGIPWANRTDERVDLKEARQILDADHTGLEEVKDRIVEHLAVRKLRSERLGDDKTEVDDKTAAGDKTDAGDQPDPAAAKQYSSRNRRGGGAILALVGPPGVGKTSLGESIAAALGRKFVRLSLGGVRDEAEIRGHRRTYVGARPGRLVAALTEAGSMNPVILLDEIDKVSSGWQGDPSAALLEVLDPAQNQTFRDHYLEFELDLSDVVFIATANVLETIPGPLLDRLEITTLDGYTENEKAVIARDHLLPRIEERNGLHPDEVEITDEAIAAAIKRFTREPGVRGLERQLDKVLRKSATKIAHDPETRIVITDDDLTDLLGKGLPADDTKDRIDRPGIATGLAVTGAGGDILFVESALVEGDGDTILTGQLGDVMKESAAIVRSIIASRDELGAGLPEGKRLHIHFPAGAVPKDGPSAGVTMTTALASLVTGRQVRADVAMTGEVTLQGRVLPIGGVKQKVLAAHRAGIKTVLLPKGNEADLVDVPDEVTEAIDIRLVGDIDEVLELALT